MKLGLAAVVACFAAAALLADEPFPRCNVVPGWTQDGAARSYVPDTLYDYMDGNSEGYLIYGFQRMRGVNCKSGETSLVIDESEMNDEEAAYGLFASNRDPRLPVEKIGVSAQIVPQRGFFVKGSRFVEISASPSSTDHAAQIRSFLQALSACVEGTTSPPAPVGWFPVEGLDAASIRLIPQSVLGLSLLKRGYLAQYDFGRAFVLRQPSAEAAGETMAKLKQRFGETQPAAVGDEGFLATDRYLGRLVFFRKGSWLGGFANVKEGVDAARIASGLAAAIR